MSEAIPSKIQTRLQWSLLALRLGIFVVMFVWTLDKFVNPGHSVAIFDKFYSIAGLNETVAYIIGAVQMLLVLAFVAGIRKRITFFKQQMNIRNLSINPRELYTLIIIGSTYDNPTSITLVNYDKI